MSIFNVSIQQVVADIGRGAFHPLDVDWTLGDVEVKRQKILGIGRSLPMKLLGNVAPELFWLLDAFFVKLFILFE